MKYQLRALLLASFFVPAVANAESRVTPVSVNATGEVIVSHDVVTVPINFQTGVTKKRFDALTAASKRIGELKKVLDGFGLDKGDYVLGNPTVYPVYSKDYKTVEGYKGTFEGSVTVAFTNDKADEITGFVAKEYNSTSVDSGLSRKARANAQIEAATLSATEARTKADAYASGVGCSIGKNDVAQVEEIAQERSYGGYERSLAPKAAPTLATDAANAERTTPVKVSAKYTFSCKW